MRIPLDMDSSAQSVYRHFLVRNNGGHRCLIYGQNRLTQRVNGNKTQIGGHPPIKIGVPSFYHSF